MERLHQLAAILVPWHRQHKRELPWRVDSSPYHTWLSEIMLQQTRIEAVIPYYYRFLQELPTIEALANAPEERLLKLWEGLGYYSRVRNLKKAAQIVMNKYGGQLPVTAKELRGLPGIGDYTAGAIASMAFGQPEPAVDGNVLRVVTRITGDDGDIMLSATKKKITDNLRAVYPTGTDAGDFTEGLMELGETICIPGGVPRCEQCPAMQICVAFQDDLTHRLPVKSEKKQRKIQPKTILVLCCNRRYALCKRPEKGLLAGMWELPNVDGYFEKDELLQWVGCCFGKRESLQELGETTHVFTHIEWHMRGCFVECEQQDERFVWVTADELLREYALPVAFKMYKDIIISKEQENDLHH